MTDSDDEGDCNCILSKIKINIIPIISFKELHHKLKE